MALDRIDRDRLAELMHSRDSLEATPFPHIHSPRWAYWQGRIDEYLAQNAIDPSEVAGLLVAIAVRS